MAARDIVLIGSLTFAISLGLFVIFFASQTVVDELMGVAAVNESAAAVESLEGVEKTINRLDWVVFALFSGLLLALIVTAWFIPANPIFAFFYVIVVVLSVIISTVLSNAWETATQSSVFGTTVQSFPIADHILMSLPLYVGIAGFVGLVVMFAKPRDEL